jgi:hypothetical protein
LVKVMILGGWFSSSILVVERRRGKGTRLARIMGMAIMMMMTELSFVPRFECWN